MNQNTQKPTENNLSLIEWCDQQASEGKKLALNWEGGHDSGWVHFTIDGSHVDNEYTEELVDKMYNHLDYGSWAGEFNATGTAVYDPEEKAFFGENHYGEEESKDIKCEILLKVPSDLWFDNLHYEMEGYNEEDPEIGVLFEVNNGFLTERHIQVAKELEKSIAEQVTPIIENIVGFYSLWDHSTVPHEGFTDNGDFQAHMITSFNANVYDSTVNEVALYLNELEEEW